MYRCSRMTSISCNQLFSRRGIGFLWENRNGLDPGQVSIINSIYNNRKKGTIECQQTVTYRLSSEKAGKLGWGRLYGTKGSLETLEKECRGTLCADYYHDLDIVNCHFVLLSQFAKTKYQRDLPEVDKYIADREAFFKEAGGSRDDAKQEIIRILYGGITKNEFLLPLSLETKRFSKFLSAQAEYSELFAACKCKDNVYGSFLSFILQTEERKCMLTMKECLERLGWSVDVLAYDGVMVRKNDKLVLDDAIKAIEAAIKEESGYEVNIINKPMSSFKIPELTEEIAKGISREAYITMKEEFEKTNFYFAPSHEMIEIQGKNLMRMSIEHAREYYSRKWRFEHSQKFGDFTAFFDIWRSDKTARSILKIDMRESDCPTVFVMPPVFAWKDGGEVATTGAVEKFREILSLIGTADQQKYITFWLAQLIQQPFTKPGTCLIITGEKRTGKDTPFDFFGKYVIGGDYSRNYTCGGSQYFEKHDTGRMNMFLCKIEEANRNTFLKNADKFKSLITAEDETFNDKGKRAVTVASYTRNVLTTNGAACPVEMSDGEQRFLIASISSARKHDIKYWAEVRKILFNAEAGRAVGEWLASLDISDFEFRKVPQDEYQSMLVESELTTEERFVQQWDGEEISAAEMFRLYRQFCISNEMRPCDNAISLGRRLIRLVRNNTIKIRKMEGLSYYSK